MAEQVLITPDWPSPASVHALITTRAGGVSLPPYASMNIGDRVGDDPAAVAENQRRLGTLIPSTPQWLVQVHGRSVRRVDLAGGGEADAAVSMTPGVVCAVRMADCLPVLLCDDCGTVVGVAHAGWRGLASGVIEATVSAMEQPGRSLIAFLGPAIGPTAFVVGDDVRQRFIAHDAAAASMFQALDEQKYLCDLYGLARQRLDSVGVTRVFGGGYCTYRDADYFFSYRRDGVTGRMAALIWIAGDRDQAK